MEYFDHFDFSELDENHQLYEITNEKVIGKMKIEISPIIELDNFVALRSNSYAYSFTRSVEIENSTQKRIQKSPKKESYFISLFNSQTTAATNYSIR